MSEQLNWQRDNFEHDFTAWEGDLWDRQRLGEQLTNYVDRLQCGAVLALDARWGEGKTWFVRHWKKHLEDQSHQVVYLDAFANDYLDDPFLTIAAEISHALNDANEIDDADIKDFNSKTASVLISLAAVMPLIAAKAGLHWVGLGGADEALQEVYKEGKEVYDTASEEIANKVKEHIEKKIENHHVEKQTIQDFKQELAELAAKLEKPLVFIIDELDRCRPDFAIRLIERIKHFFDIEKIVFVFVMNKSQLINGIQHIYGYDQESSKIYLEKFIDFEIPLSNKVNILSKNKFNLEVILNLLKGVGEESTDIALVFLLNIDKDMPARELKRKINIYALLRKEKIENNIFIALGVIKNARDVLRDMEQIAVSVLKMHEGNENIMGIDMARFDKHFFNKILERKFNIKASVISHYLEQIQANELLRQSSDHKVYEAEFSKFLNKYAFKPFEEMQYHLFQLQYFNYIQDGVWLED